MSSLNLFYLCRTVQELNSVGSYQKGSSDLTAGLTANISGSSEFPGNYQAYRAIDDVTSSFWSPSAEHVPEWIKLDFGVGNAKRIYSYSVSSGATYAPKDWILQGSNDDSVWTDLDTQVGITFLGDNERKEFNIVNLSTKYRYIRFYVTLSTQGWCNTNEWELFEAI